MYKDGERERDGHCCGRTLGEERGVARLLGSNRLKNFSFPVFVICRNDDEEIKVFE